MAPRIRLTVEEVAMEILDRGDQLTADRLAEDAGLSVRGARHWIARLLAAGKIEHGPRIQPGRSHPVYTYVRPDSRLTAESAASGSSKQQDVDTNSHDSSS